MTAAARAGLLVVTLVAAAATREVLTWRAAANAVPADAERSLRRVEQRLDALEARLGMAPPAGPAHARAAEFRTRYAALLRREGRIASRADSLLQHLPTLHPVSVGTISSGYSLRRFHPVLRQVRPHEAIDVAAPHGTPVRAAAAGRVLHRFNDAAYGTGVDLDHGNGWVSRYAHLSAARVGAGQRLARGEVLGTVGSTGRSTGPHLHFEVYFRGRARDPASLLPGSLGVAGPTVNAP